MVYKWNGVAYSVPATVVGKHFEKIEKKYGEVNSQNVLESARSEKSPIHNLFEWDDSVAAEQYRLNQAGLLIRNLQVEVESDERENIVCRAYVNVSEQKMGSYVRVDTAFQSEDTKEIVIRQALQELKAFEKKYQNLMELAEVFSAIDTVMENIG